MEYQLYGSKSSVDYDVMVFVDRVRSTEDSHRYIDKLNSELSKIYLDKVVHCNLAIVEKGVVKYCFKGTEDEVNNSLLFTYDNHVQVFENKILRKMDRDVRVKVFRTAHVILSFYSRTIYRKEIKKALKGTVQDKLNILKKYDLLSLDIVGKKETLEDIYKVLAFQYGQTIALINGTELYTKEDISVYFPDLEPALSRKDYSIDVLKKYNKIFIEKTCDLF